MQFSKRVLKVKYFQFLNLSVWVLSLSPSEMDRNLPLFECGLLLDKLSLQFDLDNIPPHRGTYGCKTGIELTGMEVHQQLTQQD